MTCKNSPPVLVTHVDDYFALFDNGISTSQFLQYLNNRVLSWRSLQRINIQKPRFRRRENLGESKGELRGTGSLPTISVIYSVSIHPFIF